MSGTTNVIDSTSNGLNRLFVAILVKSKEEEAEKNNVSERNRDKWCSRECRKQAEQIRLDNELWKAIRFTVATNFKILLNEVDNKRDWYRQHYLAAARFFEGTQGIL